MNVGNKELPLVSVAIITYNQKEYLQECIESVLSQDYPNIEIVVADDASTDGTQEMLLDYEKKYPGKFNLQLGKKNLGITGNSNRARFACSGKYIAWMGGDDLMLPEKISRQVEYMEENPACTICYHDTVNFEDKTNKILHYARDFIPRGKRNGCVRDLMKYGCFIGGCTPIIRDMHQVCFDKRIPWASDWLYYVELLLRNGGEVHYLPSLLGRHRIHSRSITKSNSKECLIDHYNSVGILVGNYPQFLKELKYRMSRVVLQLRKVHPEHYRAYLLLSLNYRFSIKILFAYFISFLGFRG